MAAIPGAMSPYDFETCPPYALLAVCEDAVGVKERSVIGPPRLESPPLALPCAWLQLATHVSTSSCRSFFMTLVPMGASEATDSSLSSERIRIFDAVSNERTVGHLKSNSTMPVVDCV